MLAAVLLIRSISVPGAPLDVKLATQVGAPYDASTIARDVRTLWSIGRFRDVQVETAEHDGAADVIFRLTPEPQYPLREIRLRPRAFDIHLSMPAATLVTQSRANQLAAVARKQLEQRGYARAKVTASLEAAPGGKADVALDIVPSEALKLKAWGDASLRAPRWYSPSAVEAHAARLRSRWIAAGYFDAQVVTSTELLEKRAVVGFRVEPGRFYHKLDTRTMCGCLFQERRTAERAGILDFDVTVAEDGTWSVERGRPFTVGRIRFQGHVHSSDAIIRRHFLLDEGERFDSWLLRQSIVRLNRSGMFELLDERQVHIAANEQTGVADITVSLTERKRGAWSFSGPLPVSASISTRLPRWSTYTLSFNALAYSTILKLASNRRFLPVLALERPFTPGGGWLSAFAFAPQLRPQWIALHYAGAQLEGRLGPWLAGTRPPDLAVTMARPSGDAAGILCEAPKPRLRAFRIGAGLALGLVRTVTN
jgi:outer membrane protein insertion porin family